MQGPERQSKVVALSVPVKAVYSKDPGHRQVYSGCRFVVTSTASPAILDWLKEQMGG
jgi:hypothetical protein